MVEEKKESKKKKITWKNILLLQAVIVIYTFSGVAGKYASGYDFLSMKFFLLYGLEIVILGIYALLWQQIIKRIDLSIAYVNRAVALLWSMIWAVFFFHENVTVKNVMGVIVVIVGTIIVNSDNHE